MYVSNELFLKVRGYIRNERLAREKMTADEVFSFCISRIDCSVSCQYPGNYVDMNYRSAFQSVQRYLKNLQLKWEKKVLIKINPLQIALGRNIHENIINLLLVQNFEFKKIFINGSYVNRDQQVKIQFALVWLQFRTRNPPTEDCRIWGASIPDTGNYDNI